MYVHTYSYARKCAHIHTNERTLACIHTLSHTQVFTVFRHTQIHTNMITNTSLLGWSASVQHRTRTSMKAGRYTRTSGPQNSRTSSIRNTLNLRSLTIHAGCEYCTQQDRAFISMHAESHAYSLRRNTQRTRTMTVCSRTCFSKAGKNVEPCVRASAPKQSVTCECNMGGGGISSIK
jgi:hypothetical protein